MPLSGPLLFYRPGGLGDVLTVLPAMRLVRCAHPGRIAFLAASESPGRLAVRLGLADRLLPIDDPALAGLFAESGGAGGVIEAAGTAPSALWTWLLREPAAEFRAAAARRFGGEARIVVYDPDSRLPIGRYYFSRAAEALGLDPSAPAFEAAARLPDSGPPRFPLPEKPFAVLHPGSGSLRKNAPLDVFLDASGDLASRGMDGFLALGPAEEALRTELDRIRLPGGWRLLQEPRLEDLAGLLSRCAAYVGNDSGVTHLAAAAGAPVLAFFRDDNLPAWRPCGRTTVLSAPEPSAISVADIRSALARFPAPSALQYHP